MQRYAGGEREPPVDLSPSGFSLLSCHYAHLLPRPAAKSGGSHVGDGVPLYGYVVGDDPLE